MRRILIALVVLVVVSGTALLGVRAYLHSQRATREVAIRLEKLYGGQVAVAGVNVGLHGSALEGVQLYDEPGTGQQATPWFNANSIRADVSLWELIRGEVEPHHLTVDGASLVLHFDRNGRLLTQFPLASSATGASSGSLDEIPEIEVHNSEVIFKKEGQPDLIATSVEAKLAREGKALVLTGSGTNKEIGNLLLAGRLEASGQLQVSLKTDKVAQVDQAFLLRVPFIPASVWEEVQVEKGESSAELTVRYDLKDKQLHYRLALAPQRTKASLPAAELTAHDLHGTVVVEDEVIDIHDLTGKAFAGTMTADGKLDFTGGTDRFDFSKIVVRGLDVSKLPASWKFPPQIKGLLDGTARVSVEYRSGSVRAETVGELVGIVAAAPGPGIWRTSATAAVALPGKYLHYDAQGTGTMRNATVDGIPVMVGIILTPAGFETTDSTSKVDESRPLPEAALVALATGTTLLLQADEAPSILDMPMRVLDGVVGGVRVMSNGIADAVDAVTHRLPQTFKPAATGEKTSYVTINLKFKDVDLQQFVDKLKVKLPYAVGGKMSLQVKASLPLNRATDIKAYKATGTAQLTDVSLNNLHLAEANADVSLAEGVLDLRTLEGRFAGMGAAPAGSIKGDARMQVEPLGDVTAHLVLKDVPLDQLPLEDAGNLGLGGAVSGQFALRIPGGKLKSGGSWDALGELASKSIKAMGLELRDASAALKLKFGILTLERFQGSLDGAPLSAEGHALLTSSYPFSAKLRLEGWDIGSLTRLTPQFRPPFALAGQLTTAAEVSGTLTPLHLNAQGDAAAGGLKIEAFSVQDAKVHWALDGKQINFTKLNAHLYGGTLTGKAVLPLEPSEGGSVSLHLDTINVKDLAKALPVPFKVEGQVAGDVKATIPPAAAGKERVASATVDLTAPALRIQNIPAEKLHAAVQYQKGVLDYKVQGSTLGGTFDLEGQVPAATQPVTEKTKEGRLKVHNLRLGRLAEALHLQALTPIRGLLSLDVQFDQNTKDRLPEGEGVLRLSEISWQGAAVADQLEGKIAIRKGIVRLQDFAGTIAQGSVRLQLGYDLARPDRSSFNLVADGVDVGQLLARSGESRLPIEGSLTARVRGKLGTEWHGSADLELNRGKIYGLQVDQWGIPAAWRYSPGQARGRVEIYETTAQVARGRAAGRLSLAWDFGAQLDGQVEFFGIDLQNLLRETTGATQLGSGQMTGRIDFTGRDARSLNDLVGTVKASFGQTQAMQIPGLRDLTPYLGIGPTTTFQKGALLGRLDRGTFRMQSLTLEGGLADIFVGGTVTLAGALNLEVVARTGFVGLPSLPLKILGLRLPVAGPLPITLVQQASDLLSNRVLYIRVTGTTRHPSARLETLKTLTQEAVRFFIYRSAGVSGTNF